MSQLTPSDRLIDAWSILQALERGGLDNTEVARRLGKAASTVHSWKMGAEPRYTDGVRLLELYASQPLAVDMREIESTKA